MSSKASSPTATLLRSSRLFSMPRPLPLPQSDILGHTQSNKVSPSATLPYPIQQAIATTPSALNRGDWGLKRNLPVRTTTKSSTPVFRVNAIDTREHITDFDSASDLTLSLKKIQELSLSVTTNPPQMRKSGRAARQNVFDAQLDNTISTPTDDKSTLRWKFSGPWLGGMTQGSFEAYVAKELKDRKAEFEKLLQSHARSALMARKRMAARHEGYKPDESSSQAQDPHEPTSQDISNYIKALRHNFTLGSELATLVQTFLDLPHVSGSALENHYARQYYEEGPPRTHPSAGLSYLRSDAFLDNHALFGPQRHHAPVEARVLSGTYRQGGPSGFGGGKIGIAGVVANDPQNARKVRSIAPLPTNDNPLEVLDRQGNSIGLGTPGGNRLWVHPTSLAVNSRGRIQMKSSNGDPTAVGVLTGQLAGPMYAEAAKRPAIRGLDISGSVGGGRDFRPMNLGGSGKGGNDAFGASRGDGRGRIGDAARLGDAISQTMPRVDALAGSAGANRRQGLGAALGQGRRGEGNYHSLGGQGRGGDGSGSAALGQGRRGEPGQYTSIGQGRGGDGQDSRSAAPGQYQGRGGDQSAAPPSGPPTSRERQQTREGTASIVDFLQRDLARTRGKNNR